MYLCGLSSRELQGCAAPDREQGDSRFVEAIKVAKHVVGLFVDFIKLKGVEFASFIRVVAHRHFLPQYVQRQAVTELYHRWIEF